MKNKLLLLILTLITHVSTAQVQEHDCPPDSKLKKEKVGKESICICANGDILNGKTVGYYSNGKLKFENHWENGKKVGVWKEWNKKGVLVMEAAYANGEQHGIESYFFDKGSIKVLTTYEKGKKNGRVAEWFESGVQNTEGSFKSEKQHGIWVFRMPDNKTVAVVKFNEGIEETSGYFPWAEKELPISLGENLK
jgi:antitoxin component YwqK of YwqJK toxin-antitoxin module